MTSSPHPQPVGIPQWNRSDRLRKSLSEAGIGVSEMAAYFGVSRNTISTWINGRVDPPIAMQRLWALRCGVPFEWLKDGLEPSSDGPDGWAPRGSNPQPTDYKVEASARVIAFRGHRPSRRAVAA